MLLRRPTPPPFRPPPSRRLPERPRSGWRLFGAAFAVVAAGALPLGARAQTPPAPTSVSATSGPPNAVNFVPAVPFTSLTSQNLAPLGKAALALEPAEWKHAETENFVYHCFRSYVDRGVTVEAEFYYRVIAHDLSKDTTHWERKAHIFIFNNPADWKLFQAKANLDPWTGGIHSNNELFLQRDSAFKFKGWTLGHETAHLVINRFYGANVPLWLNEGYAEYIGRVAYNSFYRARGYAAHPRTDRLSAEEFIPVTQLADMLSYPVEVQKVLAFYVESEKMVRFLNAADKSKFQQLLDLLAKGSLFENALHNAYGTRFPSPHLLEEEFKVAAIAAPAAVVPLDGASPLAH